MKYSYEEYRIKGSYTKLFTGSTQKLPSIVLFDASVGLQTKHHDFYVWGKNLLDKRYMGFGAGIANMGVPAEGRTFGVNYSYKF
ncbi:TonB-dependent receptor [Oligella urethralis]|uniref:TonB-dependent receptor n=1 Tax=Oligella urethralis TaxID=90245 RepID=UPI000DF8F692|nr:TonB-dependent receptor [Oligella urethralis]SUA63799.1 Outer membrane receptor for monomeric catechols [Oligella urethralis]